MMGIWYLSTATANKFAGMLSGLYPEAGKVKSIFGYQIATMYDLLYGIRCHVRCCFIDSVPSLEEITEDDAWSGIKSYFCGNFLKTSHLWIPYK